jgi:hypothetical protein
MSELFVRVYVDGAVPIDKFHTGAVNSFEVSTNGVKYRANSAGTTLGTVHQWMKDEGFRIVRISVETEQRTAVFKLSDMPIGASGVLNALVDGTGDAPPVVEAENGPDREAAAKAIKEVNELLEERGPVRNPIRLQEPVGVPGLHEDVSQGYAPWG